MSAKRGGERIFTHSYVVVAAVVVADVVAVVVDVDDVEKNMSRLISFFSQSFISTVSVAVFK